MSTVVLFELEDAQGGVGVLEVQYVLYVRATERVDALCVVANHGEAVAVAAQFRDDAVLREVGILVLVDQYVSENS